MSTAPRFAKAFSWWCRALRGKSEAFTALSIAIAVASYANGEGVCWPSLETLAEDAACAPKTASRAIRTLVEAGILLRSRRRRRSNVYRLLDSPPSEEPRAALDSPSVREPNGLDSPEAGLDSPEAVRLTDSYKNRKFRAYAASGSHHVPSAELVAAIANYREEPEREARKALRTVGKDREIELVRYLLSGFAREGADDGLRWAIWATRNPDEAQPMLTRHRQPLAIDAIARTVIDDGARERPRRYSAVVEALARAEAEYDAGRREREPDDRTPIGS